MHRYAVIEMGMNHFGEIDYLTRLAEPTVAVITLAGAAHLEGVGHTMEGVAKAKAEIFAGLSQDGTAILNRDDQFYDYWKKETASFKQLSFGFHPEADVNAIINEQQHESQLIITTPNEIARLTLPLLGKHNIMNALSAVAAATALSVPLATCVTALSAMTPEHGRLCLSVLPSGTTLIDDTYNANPTSFLAAIHTLATYSSPTILIMGDMKELGRDAKSLHDKIGNDAKNAGITHLFTYGELSQAASNAFGENAKHFTDINQLCQLLENHCKPNVTMLVKGSRSMQMERVIDYLTKISVDS
jgi:UDP-N-acetylmuramoyl-tripeptide--D-alanyl-D-alanine ligase